MIRCRVFKDERLSEKDMRWSPHQYMFISPRIGVKWGGAYWGLSKPKTLRKLESSADWKTAKKEYLIQQIAYRAGLAPRPIELSAIKLDGFYRPLLKMHHFNLLTIGDAYMRLEDDVCIRYNLNCELLAIGIWHRDLHEDNVLIRKNHRGVVQAYAIDFEMALRIPPVPLETLLAGKGKRLRVPGYYGCQRHIRYAPDKVKAIWKR